MSKKSLLIATIASMTFFYSNAQIKKGAIFLGGDIGGSAQKTKTNITTTDKQTGITISPVWGKAIKENLILGANAGFNFYTNDNTGTASNQKQNSYGLGIFLRKYKQVGKSGFSLFFQGGIGSSYYTLKTKGPAAYFDDIKRYNITVNAYPGISYTVNKKLQLETGFNNLLTLNYYTEKRDIGGGSPLKSKTNGFNISSSLNNLSSLYVGFRVLLN